MSILGTKKNKDVKKVEETSKKEEGAPKNTTSLLKRDIVIKNPRITEKASFMSETSNVYTFDITKGATKKWVANAVKNLYKVVPVKVNVVTIRAKKVFVRGKMGAKAGGKKAYVYLKKGDKIEIV